MAPRRSAPSGRGRRASPRSPPRSRAAPPAATIGVGPLPDADRRRPERPHLRGRDPRPEPPRAGRLAQRAREGARRRPDRPGAAARAGGLPRPGRDRAPRGRRPARHAHGGRRHAADRAVVLGRTFVTAADAVNILERGRPTAKLGAAPTRPAGIAAADFDTQARGGLDRPEHVRALRPAHAAAASPSRPAGQGPTNVVAFGDLLFVADTSGNAVLTYSTRPRLRAVDRMRAARRAVRAGGRPDPPGPARDAARTATVLTTLSIANGHDHHPRAFRPSASRTRSRSTPRPGRSPIAGHADGRLQLMTDERLDAPLRRPARPPG